MEILLTRDDLLEYKKNAHINEIDMSSFKEYVYSACQHADLVEFTNDPYNGFLVLKNNVK